VIEKTSSKGIDRIILREQLCLTSYQCQAGVWTIGIGHTAGVKPGMKITRERALELLQEDLEPIHRQLVETQLHGAVMTQEQFDALASFMMPIGVTAYHTSTLRRYLINNAEPEAIARQIRRWIWYTDRRTGEKKKSQGLINRRDSEAKQYMGLL
jgi:Phage-related lysozyme (muraminidase)